MTRIIVSLALLLALPSGIVAASETRTDDPRDGQVSSEKRAPGLTLRELLSRFAKNREPKPVEVTYTRAWIDALPVATGDEEWQCLSEALYFEARGETVKGQFAVAEVIVNRVASARFPATLCGVIHQGTGRRYQCQFTYTCDGYSDKITEKDAYARVSKVARLMIDGVDGNLTDGATYYHNKSVRPAWSRRFTRTASIGVHLFYRPNYRTASTD